MNKSVRTRPVVIQKRSRDERKVAIDPLRIWAMTGHLEAERDADPFAKAEREGRPEKQEEML